MKQLTVSILALSALALAGCSEQSRTALEPDQALFASGKSGGGGGGGSTDTRPRANIVWSDAPHNFTPGIEGDSRSKDGSTKGVLDEYQGNYCGAYAVLYAAAGESGDLNADFDSGYTTDMLSACGSSRSLTFHMGGSLGDVKFAPYFVVRGLTHLAVNESRLQFMGFGIQQTDCQRVMFDSQYAGASDARITRLADTETRVRQWRVESQGTHKGQCVAMRKNGTLYPVGDPITLPFSFTVTEVPHPAPTYPS